MSFFQLKIVSIKIIQNFKNSRLQILCFECLGPDKFLNSYHSLFASIFSYGFLLNNCVSDISDHFLKYNISNPDMAVSSTCSAYT